MVLASNCAEKICVQLRRRYSALVDTSRFNLSVIKARDDEVSMLRSEITDLNRSLETEMNSRRGFQTSFQNLQSSSNVYRSVQEELTRRLRAELSNMKQELDARAAVYQKLHADSSVQTGPILTSVSGRVANQAVQTSSDAVWENTPGEIDDKRPETDEAVRWRIAAELASKERELVAADMRQAMDASEKRLTLDVQTARRDCEVMRAQLLQAVSRLQESQEAFQAEKLDLHTQLSGILTLCGPSLDSASSIPSSQMTIALLLSKLRASVQMAQRENAVLSHTNSLLQNECDTLQLARASISRSCQTALECPSCVDQQDTKLHNDRLSLQNSTLTETIHQMRTVLKEYEQALAEKSAERGSFLKDNDESTEVLIGHLKGEIARQQALRMNELSTRRALEDKLHELQSEDPIKESQAAKQKLREALSHIRVLLTERRSLLEVGNRLRRTNFQQLDELERLRLEVKAYKVRESDYKRSHVENEERIGHGHHSSQRSYPQPNRQKPAADSQSQPNELPGRTKTPRTYRSLHAAPSSDEAACWDFSSTLSSTVKDQDQVVPVRDVTHVRVPAIEDTSRARDSFSDAAREFDALPDMVTAPSTFHTSRNTAVNSSLGDVWRLLDNPSQLSVHSNVGRHTRGSGSEPSTPHSVGLRTGTRTRHPVAAAPDMPHVLEDSEVVAHRLNSDRRQQLHLSGRRAVLNVEGRTASARGRGLSSTRRNGSSEQRRRRPASLGAMSTRPRKTIVLYTGYYANE